MLNVELALHHEGPFTPWLLPTRNSPRELKNEISGSVSHSYSHSCTRGDFVKVFLHLENEGVSEYTPWSGILCGELRDIPQILYSSRSTLILELHTELPSSNATGFSGTFRFIDRRKFFDLVSRLFFL
ncbi:suppressor of lurcher protein 1 isoform X1 [Vespula squamosa]|uniref:Suppressor of lurcher protein 1 isoform X1 n=1 Tax=Vespula squamosa TaxID=30214 RepID=A0ABD2A2B8_VESSQ